MVLRVLEFYCGIGGVHYALSDNLACEVVAAYDINTTTNAIYAHNFPGTRLCQKNIQSLSREVLDEMNVDVWTMSPPCQPFTLKGLQLGEEDRRCDSLKSLMTRILEMSNPPRFLFLENVCGFEGTSMHQLVTSTLSTAYEIEEYILCPTQFGVPNTRPRYYLLARCSAHPPVYTMNIGRVLPSCSSAIAPRTLGDFVCSEELEKDPTLAVESTAAEGAKAVSPSATSSSCFTKSYGQYRTGCGSLHALPDGRTRLFSPREVANLMAFPASFSWPESTTRKQLYRALGNSVNVLVVHSLLKHLLQSSQS